MKTFPSLQDVLASIDQLSWEGTLFVDPSAWERSPAGAGFVYLAGDDELEDVEEGTGLPRLAREHDVRYFLDAQAFKDVVEVQRQRDSRSTVDDIILALNHYREYDAFYWPRTE